MANTTPTPGNPPTSDPAAKISADSATGTATEKSVKAPSEAKAEETSEEQREPGSLWTAPVASVEGGEEGEEYEAARTRAREEEKARLENPDEVVYRAADTEL